VATRQEDNVENESMLVCEMLKVFVCSLNLASLCLVLPRQKKETSTYLLSVFLLVFQKRSSTTRMYVAGL